MNNKVKIQDFYKEFKNHSDKNLVLVKGAIKINNNEDISLLKQKMHRS